MYWLGIACVLFLILAAIGVGIAIKGKIQVGATDVFFDGDGNKISAREYERLTYNDRERSHRTEPVYRSFRWVGVLIAILGVLFAALTSVRIVPANTVGIPVTFGKVGESLGSGFHITNPFTDVTKFSTRIQEFEMKAPEGAPCPPQPGDESNQSIDVRGSDEGVLCVDSSVRFSILPEAAPALFKRFKSLDAVESRLVRSEAREAIRQAFVPFSSEEGLSAERAAAQAAAQAALAERLAPYGLTVDAVVLRGIRPSGPVQAKIDAKLQKQQEAEAALLDQAKQTTEAETRRQVADTDAEAKRLAAAGTADARRAEADAEADAIRALAEAQAQANAEVAASLTPDLIDYQRALALSEAETIYVPADGNVLIGPNPR